MANPPAQYPDEIFTPTDISVNSDDPLGSTPKTHTETHGQVEEEIAQIETKLGVGDSPAEDATDGDVLVVQADGSTLWESPPSSYYPNLIISRGGIIIEPVDTLNVAVWEVPYACTVQAIKAYCLGDTGVDINAFRWNSSEGYDDLLVADYSLIDVDTWENAGTLQNVNLVAGDYLYITIRALTGSPTQVAVQINAQTDGVTTINANTHLFKSGSGIVTVSDADYDVTPPLGTVATAQDTDTSRRYICTRVGNNVWNTVEVS